MPLVPITRENAHRLKLWKILSYGAFRALALSPDGKIAAVGSTRGIWLHDAAALELPPTQLQTTIRSANALDFSSDGELLASAEEDGFVRVWHIGSRRLLHEHHAHMGAATGVKFSPDGKRLFTGGEEQAIHIWDTETWAKVATLFHAVQISGSRHQDAYSVRLRSITHLVFTPDASTLIACGDGYTHLVLWDLTTLTERGVIDMENNTYVGGIAFADDGRTMVVRCSRGEVSLYAFWDVASLTSVETVTLWAGLQAEWTSQKQLWMMEPRENYIAQLHNGKTGEHLTDFDFAGKYAARGSDHTRGVGYFMVNIELWDIPTNRMLSKSIAQYWDFGGEPIFSRDSTRVSVAPYWGGSGRHVWDMDAGIPVALFEANIGDKNNSGTLVYFAQNGDLHALLSNRQGTVELRDLANNQTLSQFHYPQQGLGDMRCSFAVDRDERMVAVGTEKGVVYLWHPATGEHDVLWKLGGQKTICQQFSPDGSLLAVMTDSANALQVTGSMVRLLDLKTRQVVMTVPGYRATFTPDGTSLIVWTTAQTKRPHIVWDIATQTQVGALPAYSPYVDRLSFNHDGRIVLIASHSTIELWDWRQQELLASPKMPDGEYILGANFSPDGKVIAIVSGHSGELYLWGVEEA